MGKCNQLHSTGDILPAGNVSLCPAAAASHDTPAQVAVERLCKDAPTVHLCQKSKPRVRNSIYTAHHAGGVPEHMHTSPPYTTTPQHTCTRTVYCATTAAGGIDCC
jgi:hypothetical protein